MAPRAGTHPQAQAQRGEEAKSFFRQAAERQAAERAAQARPHVPQAPPEHHALTEAAFADADRATGERNWVSLDALRARLPGLSRAQQDAAINDLRQRGQLTLDSHEGRHGPLTETQRGAAIREGGSLLPYLSRRTEPESAPPAPAPRSTAPIAGPAARSAPGTAGGLTFNAMENRWYNAAGQHVTPGGRVIDPEEASLARRPTAPAPAKPPSPTEQFRAAEAGRRGEATSATVAPKSTTLPALKGSEKQVQWANDVRARTLAKIDRDLASKVGAGSFDFDDPSIDPDSPEATARFRQARDFLVKQEHAKFWIDSKDAKSDDLVRGWHNWDKHHRNRTGEDLRRGRTGNAPFEPKAAHFIMAKEAGHLSD